jgi:hypothetical protein
MATGLLFHILLGKPVCKSRLDRSQEGAKKGYSRSMGRELRLCFGRFVAECNEYWEPGLPGVLYNAVSCFTTLRDKRCSRNRGF